MCSSDLDIMNAHNLAMVALTSRYQHECNYTDAELAKRGLRSLYAPEARAEEKMVPTIEGEFARKRDVGRSARGYSGDGALCLDIHQQNRRQRPGLDPCSFPRRPRTRRLRGRHLLLPLA